MSPRLAALAALHKALDGLSRDADLLDDPATGVPPISRSFDVIERQTHSPEHPYIQEAFPVFGLRRGGIA